MLLFCVHLRSQQKRTEKVISSYQIYSVAILTLLFKLECGPMPNVMAALPNIGGALCSTPQSLADAHY